MKKILILLFASWALFSFQRLQAQTSPAVQWEKTLGGSSAEACYSVQQTPDGGYFVAGDSKSNISGDKTQVNWGGNTITSDYWVVRLDAAGNKLWDRTIGGTSTDNLRVFRVTPDGGFVMGGFSNSPISGDKSQTPKGGTNDFWVVKYDALANKQWDRTIGGNDADLLYTLELTADGGYILGGESSSGISGDKSQINKGLADYWIVKLDALGNKVWDKTYGSFDTDILTSIKQTSDGGYILGGYSNSTAAYDKTQLGRGFTDYWVVRINATGTKLWDKTIGGSGTEQLSSVLQTDDGSFILGGWSTSNISGDKTQVSKGLDDFYVVKLDANGTIIWDKAIGGNSSDQIYDMQKTADGGFIAGGLSYSGISGDKTQASRGLEDYWLVKMDQNGNKIWDKTLGGSNHEQINTLIQTNDGGYIMGGTTYSGAGGDKSGASKGGTDYWVIKLGPNCAELSANLAIICGTGSSNVQVLISGMLPTIAGNPGWTLTYTVNNVTQTLQGNSAVASLAQNVAPGTVFSLISITSGSCTTTLNNTITTHAIPGTPTVTSANRCNSGSVTLTASGALTGENYNWYATSNAGTPLQTGVSGIFNTPVLTTTTTYYVAIANAGGCESNRIPVTATVTNLTAVAGPAQVVCVTAAPFQLTGFSPAGGTWSGPGVNVSGLFTPSNNLVGIQTLTYTYTANGCTVTSTKTVTVNALPVVSAGINESVCSNASPMQLTGFSPSGGTWTGPGVTAGGLFTPSTNLIGNQTLTYTVNQNGCTSSATKDITVTGAPTVTAGSPLTICSTAQPLQLSGFTPGGGTWSGPGVSATGLFTPNLSLVGNQVLTYTVSQNNCNSSATQVVTVAAEPTVSAGPNQTVFAYSAPFQLTGFSPAGGTWSGPGVNSAGLFTPSAALVGTQTLTYTYSANTCTVASTKQITIPTPPAQPTVQLITPDTLMSSVIGDSYEWKFNGNVLPATTRKIKATISGLYSVQVMTFTNGPSLYSLDYNFTRLGTKEALDNSLNLYPNPSNGWISLDLNNFKFNQVVVYNSLSQVVLTKVLNKSYKGDSIKLDLSKEAKGVYTIKVLSENQVITRKVVLQ